MSDEDDDLPKYNVEAILDDGVDDDTKEHRYLVKCEGYSEEENSWEPKANLLGCADMLQEYEKEKKKKLAKEPKAPKAPKASKPPNAPKASKPPNAPKASKTRKAPKAPKAPEAPAASGKRRGRPPKAA